MPDAVVHLGDHYDDAQTLREEYPWIPFFAVPGNCDRYRCPDHVMPILCSNVCGVRLFMTHGHLHHVKQTCLRLEKEARTANAQAALYGHTHSPDCRLEEGMWILNPGSCGYGGGTVGIIEADRGQILSCEILRTGEL